MAASLVACASGGSGDGNDPPDAAPELCLNVDCSSLTDQCNVGSCNPTTGECEAQPREDGTLCGSVGDTECDNPDTCVAGVCVENLESAGALCGDIGVDCLIDDTCDGAGNCVDNGVKDMGAACGDTGVDCFNDDTCNGSGLCIDNGFRVAGAACGDPTAGECDAPDSCDGAGACLTNPLPQGTLCGTVGVDCQVDDTCNGAGACVDNGPSAIGTPCGNQLSTQCSAPDSCDGAGGCLANHMAAGTACGDQGVECLVDDACDGAGVCADSGFQPAGMACGDPTMTDCTAPDSCNATGLCQINDAADGATCNDCPLGSGLCDTCEAGVCLNGGDCQEAGSIACNGTVAANNGGTGSTNRVDTYPACTTGSNTGPEIAYSFVPDGDGIAVATLTGLSADVDLFVVEATANGFCSSTTCVDASRLGGTSNEFVQWNAVAGTTYFLVVDGFSGNTSNFVLSVVTPTEFILLSEISGETTDYVEVQSLSACAADLDPYSILHRGDCDTAAQQFDFPAGSIIAPGGVFRFVDGTVMFANEVATGVNICDFEDGSGHTALCDGPCDLTTCANFVDYVERDAGGTIGGPTCGNANFDTPINTTGAPVGQTSHRTSFIGGIPNWLNSDWEILSSSRTP